MDAPRRCPPTRRPGLARQAPGRPPHSTGSGSTGAEHPHDDARRRRDARAGRPTAGGTDGAEPVPVHPPHVHDHRRVRGHRGRARGLWGRQVRGRGRRRRRQGEHDLRRHLLRPGGDAVLLERLHRGRRPLHDQDGRRVHQGQPQHHRQAEHRAVGGVLPADARRGDRRQGSGRRRHAPRPARDQCRAQGDRARRRPRQGSEPAGVGLHQGRLAGRDLQGRALRHSRSTCTPLRCSPTRTT